MLHYVMFYQASNLPHFFCLVSFGFEEAEKEVLDFAMCYQASNLPHFSTLLSLASFFFVEEVEKEVLDFVMFYLRSLKSSPSPLPNCPFSERKRGSM